MGFFLLAVKRKLEKHQSLREKEREGEKRRGIPCLWVMMGGAKESEGEE